MKLAVVVSFLCCCITGLSQNLSNKGKEFWVGYGHHQFMEPGLTNRQEMVLYFSAEQTANVKVTINTTTYVRNYVVAAGTVIASEFLPKAGTFDCRLYSLPPSFGGTGGEGIFDRGIHIESDVPIVAYAHIFGSASSGATMLMPVETYGYSYVSVNSPQVYNTDCFSWLYVVAKENDTRIEITPSVPTRNGRAAGVPFQVDLQKGQIYQVIGDMQAGIVGYELTGTKVVSRGNAAGKCHPIAVFAGSSRTAITCPPGGNGSGDNNMQQIFPSQAWGKRYLTAPTSNANNVSSFHTNLFKIAVKDPTTVVKRNGVVLTGIINNFYYQYQSNTADYIEADKPILVAQFMSSAGACPNTSGDGDPEMMYISPLEQGIKRVGFYRNTRENINSNYLTLIIPTPGVSSLTIDGTSTFSHTYPHPALTGYTVVVRRWTSAQAQCIVQSDSAFTAVTYGLGNVESYGYNAGTLVNNLAASAFIHNENDATAASHQYTCENSPVEISMLVAYKPNKIVWRLSQLAAINPNTDVTDLNPAVIDSVLINGVKYYKYRLPGTYTFSQTGTFELPVQNTHPSLENCNNTEEVLLAIAVKDSPKSDFTFNFSGCILDTVHFSSPANSGNGYTINKWTWTFPDATTATIQNPSKKFNTTGTKTINLRVISSEGCVGDTTRDIVIYDKPSATFGITPATGCEGDTLKFTDMSSYGGSTPISSWYWDFGNNHTITVDNGNPQTMHYPAYGTYTVRHAVKLGNACSSDTVSKVVKISANPVLGFTFPVGCLPVNGIVQFTSTTTTPDGQGFASYSWNFGDPNATPANPNTSTLPNPTHTYSAFGTYDIIYSVTTVNGCKATDTVTATFNVRPGLSYPALASVCENATPLSVATATVTNGVTGTGVYRGPGTTAAGIFNAAAAGAGTHIIWYVFTSAGGCKDSVSSTIKVFPKPAALFNAAADACAGTAVTITDRSTISGGRIVSWKWDFGNITSATNNNGNPFTISYPNQGTYTVKLVAVSDSGCVSDTASQIIRVHALPKANFNMPASICMPDGNAQFQNLTNVADNSGLNYQWNFGDGSTGSTATNPTHTYTRKGPFTVMLTATTAFGCTHDTSKLLDVFFDKPVAAFAVSPDTLCQGTDNVFTDLSTPAASIRSWAWTFGDNSTSTNPSPGKRYALPGKYDVKLTVTNNAGCVSDAFTKTVVVYLQPVVDAGPSFVVAQGSIIQFKATANDSATVQFQWQPAADFTNANVLRPRLIAMRDQVYTVTATGQGNCTASDELTVKIQKPVRVPNAFSPNNDGVNDAWVLGNLGDYAEATVEVYNRYGQVIYRANAQSRPWDGTYKGTPLPVATYYYIIDLRNGTVPMRGSVTIIR